MQWVNLLLANWAAYYRVVPFAVIVSARWAGDPRTYGSGNPEQTNVLRSGSKWARRSRCWAMPSRGAGGVACAAIGLQHDRGRWRALVRLQLSSALVSIFFASRRQGVATAAGVVVRSIRARIGPAITWVIGRCFCATRHGVDRSRRLAPFIRFGGGFDARFVALVVIMAFGVPPPSENRHTRRYRARIGAKREGALAGRRWSRRFASDSAVH